MVLVSPWRDTVTKYPGLQILWVLPKPQSPADEVKGLRALLRSGGSRPLAAPHPQKSERGGFVRDSSKGP